MLSAVEDRSYPLTLVILGSLISVAILVVGAIQLLDVRRDNWHRAEVAAQDVAFTLDQDISQTLASYDLSIQAAISVLDEPGLGDVPPRIRHSALFDGAAAANWLGAMFVLDRDGKVVYDSTSLEATSQTYRDREFFAHHLKGKSPNELYIGQPFKSRLRGGDQSVSISRRLTGPDGAFAGVVVGAVRMEYFKHLFESVRIGNGGRISLLRSDGRLVAHYPLDDKIYEADFSNAPLFKATQAAQSGQVKFDSLIDGVQRLYTFRHIEGFPLTLVVACDTSDIVAGWWRQAVLTGSGLLILSLATIGLTILLRRELGRRCLAEQKLKLAAQELEREATTDHLTGLGNRRLFSRTLEREWRWAISAGAPISLLMIDADLFKNFNDSEGHQKGDEVLRIIAECISTSIRRPGELAYRYGGEEFAVILPNVTEPGAKIVAERIRTGVFERNFRHPCSPHAKVSVSIGAATLNPSSDTQAEMLIGLADRALYAAKQAGRNIVKTANGTIQIKVAVRALDYLLPAISPQAR